MNAGSVRASGSPRRSLRPRAHEQDLRAGQPPPSHRRQDRELTPGAQRLPQRPQPRSIRRPLRRVERGLRGGRPRRRLAFKFKPLFTAAAGQLVEHPPIFSTEAARGAVTIHAESIAASKSLSVVWSRRGVRRREMRPAGEADERLQRHERRSTSAEVAWTLGDTARTSKHMAGRAAGSGDVDQGQPVGAALPAGIVMRCDGPHI